MFALVFRDLVVIVAGLIVVWFLWTRIRKIGRRDSRKEQVREALDNIEEILELSKEVKVNPKKLKSAREKLAQLKEWSK